MLSLSYKFISNLNQNDDIRWFQNEDIYTYNFSFVSLIFDMSRMVVVPRFAKGKC